MSSSSSLFWWQRGAEKNPATSVAGAPKNQSQQAPNFSAAKDLQNKPHVETAAQQQANSRPETIVRADQIPNGNDVTSLIGFPADMMSDIVVLCEGGIIHDGQKVTLIINEAHYLTPMMFDARRRLERNGLVLIRTAPSSVEMLKAMKARQREASAGSTLAQSDKTGAEKCFSEIVNDAVRLKASDIHIETREGQADVYYRINGTRVYHKSLSKETAEQMGFSIYNVYAEESSKEVAWDKTRVIDGAIDYKTDTGSSVQLRFSSSPIHPAGNFQIVMRVIVMDPDRDIALSEMGYEPQQIRAIETMVTGSNGMVLLCGPTNSGKSTSMASMLRLIFDRRGSSIKIITVEDPVERVIKGACQIGVASKKGAEEGNVFAKFLKGVLRQDPDVAMIGEIRDRESAEIVKDFVLAGRKLLTTLHSYSALWAFVRLREIGVPLSLLAMPGFISGIIYQRLVPTLCSNCSIPITSPEISGRIPSDVLNRVTHVCDIATDNIRIRGNGCPTCRGSGIVGRTVVAEFVMPDQKLLKYIAEEDYIQAYEYWRDAKILSVGNIGVTALSHAIYKMKQGLLDPMDVETQVNILTNDLVMGDSILAPDEMDAALGQVSVSAQKNW